MATETENIKLKVIEGKDQVSKELINANTEILEDELTELKRSAEDLHVVEADLATAQADISQLSARVTNNAQNISNLAITVAGKEDSANKGIAGGYPSLDANGKVPVSQLPSTIKEMLVVANIAARNAISDVYDGLRVRVLDATGDNTVTAGWAEYVYMASTSSWEKTAEKESMDVVLDWSNLQNIPDVLKALSVINQKLAYNGNVVNEDIRVVTFIGGDSEIPYPWTGVVQKIQVNCSEAQEADLVFSVEKQSMADYAAKTGNWQLLGGSQLSLDAGQVYREYLVTDTVAVGDVIRASTVGDDTGVTFQVLIKNNA